MHPRYELKRALRGLLLEIDPNEVSTTPLPAEFQALMLELLRPERAAELNHSGGARSRVLGARR